MRQKIRVHGSPRLGDKVLPQILLGDYQQAAAKLDHLAIMFRTRESQLRDFIVSLEKASLPAKINATPCDMTAHRAPTVAFFCFGRFRVEVQGIPVETRGGSKALKVLKFLVQRRRPCAREVLLETLWPESEPKTALNRLHVLLHTLRHILGAGINVQDIIVYHGGCYELNSGIDSWADADEFEALWRQGVRFEAGGRRQEATQRYEQAALLYQGDYLEEDLYEEWTFLRRESLRDAYLHLLGKLAGWYMEEGDHGSCISYCHKILAEDPYREDAYRVLMRCYVALGYKANALHWYEVCCANLKKGLDANPSLETTRLQRQIIADEK